MRRVLGILVPAFIIAMAPAVAAQEEGITSSAGAEIRALETALADAMHVRDAARLDLLLAPDYVLRSVPDVDRATWMRNAISLCWGGRSDIDRFRIQHHDRVVVATFEMTFYQDPTTCRPAVLRSEITDIWIQRPEGWRLQVRHASAPPAGDAGVVAQYGIVPAPPPTWDISSEFSFVATGGNTTTHTTGVGSDVTHRSGHTTSHGSVSYLSSAADGLTNARALSIQARQALAFGQRFQVFGEGAYTRDRFAGIDGRTTVTLGLGYSPAMSRRHRLTVEAGIGGTGEQRVGVDLRFATASGAAHYAWMISPGIRLTGDVGFSADLESGMNWRQTGVTAIAVTLSRWLSFKASHSFEYRNVPVVGFGRTDMRTSAALVLSLQQRARAR